MSEVNESASAGAWAGIGSRLLLWSPLMVGLVLACWLTLAFTGWGPESSPRAQFARDAPWLAVSAITGVAAVAVFRRAIRAGMRYWAVGALPAILMTSAYFTFLY